MTGDLRADLRRCLAGKVCLVGVGNVDLGDDGFGVRLAEALDGAETAVVISAGTAPERWVGKIAREGFDSVVFLDAVEVDAPAGSAILLRQEEMVAAYPQLSTHKFSLGTLARLIESQCDSRVWLLGVRPGRLRRAGGLSREVRESMDALRVLIGETLRTGREEHTRSTGS